MDKILIGVITLAVILFFFGLYVLYYPTRYQNNGTTCEKIAMSTCNSVKNDYYIFGSVMILFSMIIGSLCAYEIVSLKTN